MMKIELLKNDIHKKIKLFFKELIINPFFVVMALAFTTVKIVSNLIMGASVANALRSGIMGCLFYILACFIINMLSKHTMPNPEVRFSRIELSKIMIWYAVIVIVITISVLYSHDIISFKIRIWHRLQTVWANWINSFLANNPRIEKVGLIGWPNLILFALVPGILMGRKRLPRFCGLKNSFAAWPFAIIYLTAFILLKGLKPSTIFSLFFVIFWPALGEEFFYRGIMQRIFIDFFNNPIKGIVLTSILFTICHIPTYFLSYPNALSAFSALMPLLMTSFFWGYGYYRTGVLWPWILIHALSNLVGF